MEIVKNDLKVVGVIEKDAMNRERLRIIICYDSNRKRKTERRRIGQLFVISFSLMSA